MSFPTTPTKKGDGINQIARALNAKWRLDLAVRDSLWSPSRVSSPGLKEEQIFQLLRYLYFKHLVSLQDALRKFDVYASKYTSSKWVFKPWADPDTLPSRACSASPSRRDFSSRQPYLSENVTDALKDTLIHLLSEARDYPLDDSSETLTDQLSFSPDRQRLRGKAELQALDQLCLSSPLFPPSEILPKAYPLAEDFPLHEPSLGAEPVENRTEVDRVNVPKRRNSRTQMAVRGGRPFSAHSKQRSEDDVFTTPFTSPSRNLKLFPVSSLAPTSSARTDSQDERIFFQGHDVIKIPSVTASPRKRSIADDSMLTNARQMSRETTKHKVPRLFRVNHIIPVTAATHSFDNLASSSFSTLTTSTTRTTPSTSFYIESAATSFSSVDNADHSFSAQPVHGKAEHCEQQDKPSRPEDPMELDLDSDIADPQFDSSLRWPIAPAEGVLPPVRDATFTSQFSERLRQESPFKPPSFMHMPQSFRYVYETSRVALHCGISVMDLSHNPRRENGEQGEFWSSLEWACKRQNKVPPQQSALDVWKRTEKTFQGVVLSGELAFAKKAGGSVFELRLHPLKLEKPHRFSLKFGSDRYLVLSLPGLEAKDLPPYLKSNATAARDAIISWVRESCHSLLGRTWRAFFVKTKDNIKNRKSDQKTTDTAKYRVYFFATTGQGFIDSSCEAKYSTGKDMPHISMTIKEMLDWFIPPKCNMQQPSLKLYARIALGVSPVSPTVEFKPHQIVRSRDAFANSPGERRLSTNRHRTSDVTDASSNKETPKSAVMNDGCARISRAAAIAIARSLDLNSHIPSAFQGRIGGAKGVWIVDAIEETLPEFDDDFWIEITDSQLKFERAGADTVDSDSVLLTFGSVGPSMPLSSHTLNFQLIPILVDRGVPDHVILKFLEDDLNARAKELRDAMDNGLKLRKWNQENNPVTEIRVRSKTVEIQGALPESLPEKINWFVEHGFEPQACNHLNILCSRTIKYHCEQLESRGNVKIGCSAYALMIADPLGILEENEIHLGFSNTFKDSKSGFQDTLLNDMDVLVARTPAHLPSDIQKVRAVFKPELSLYKDVVVFPAKGERSLADKLSGGDYDGDKAWICWDPVVVGPFVNADMHLSPRLEFYGITKNETKISDIIHEPDFTSLFLRQGFEFNLQQSFTGICTNYYESFCYKQKSIDSPMAKDIALLLGHLVDSAKGGLIFNNQTWKEFLQRNGLPSYLPPPAYKDKKNSDPTDHVIDKLVLLAKKIKDNSLESLTKYFKIKAANYDDDLVMLWKEIDEEAKTDTELKGILSDLRVQLRAVKDYWGDNMNGKDAEAGNDSSGSIGTTIEQARQMFLDIRPLAGSQHPLARRWAKQVEKYETDRSKEQDEWGLLKASALFFLWQTGGFPWYVAGAELGRLKLKNKHARQMVESIFIAMKLDARFLSEREEEGVKGVDEWDEFDEDGWDDLD